VRRALRIGVIALVVAFLAIQAVPYGWWDANPPAVSSVEWPSAEAEQIARVACYDCHSHETERPFYSFVAPFSWLTRSDVEEGRDELNFSDWDGGGAGDAIEVTLEGEMPPLRYTLIHRDAKLSDSEVAALVAALDELDRRR